MKEARSTKQPTLRTAVLRGMKLRCPNCGEGKLFSSYIKPVRVCEVCNEPFYHIRTDDAAPWLTILIVGHVIVPMMVISASSDLWPKWLAALVWPTMALLLGGTILPHAKGVMISIIWSEKTIGSEEDK